MQHNHELGIRDRYLMYNETIIKEINLYMDCQVPPATISQLLNKKYNISTKYSDVYHAVKIIKQSFKEANDLGKHDIYELIEILEDLKHKDPDTRFAYVMDSNADSKDGKVNGEPKLDRMII
jgi:hypothetical protein